MLQECMMIQLREFYPGLKLGHYFHNAGSMHIYELHYEMAEEILKEDAIDLEMIPMDAFNQNICNHLMCIEQEWREAGSPEDFDFESIWEWSQLTPYWQTVVQALFLKDQAALHQLFAHPETDDEQQ
jgi:thymidylate synthase